ncbi:MAG: LamG-like jellyroll fold domain-containing protein [Verrucomicrobiota bacterium]
MSGGGPRWVAPAFLGGHLMVQYSFDRKVKQEVSDVSGQNSHARAVGGTWVKGGRIGGGFEFTRISDRIIANDYRGITGDGARTVAFWFKDAGTGKKGIVIYWGEEEDPGNLYRINFYEGKLYADGHWGDAKASRLGPTMLDGDWHHAVIVYPKNGALRDIMFYVDGEADITTVKPQQIGEDPLNTTGGQEVVIGEEALFGVLDELLIIDRELTEAEVLQLYRSYE